jgi:hypothetical protein
MNNFKKILNLRLNAFERKNNNFIINYMKILERKNAKNIDIKTTTYTYISNIITCYAGGAFIGAVLFYPYK